MGDRKDKKERERERERERKKERDNEKVKTLLINMEALNMLIYFVAISYFQLFERDQDNRILL